MIINRTPSTSHSRLWQPRQERSYQPSRPPLSDIASGTYAAVISAVIHSCTYFISHPAEGTVCTAKSASRLTFQMHVFIHGGHRVSS